VRTGVVVPAGGAELGYGHEPCGDLQLALAAQFSARRPAGVADDPDVDGIDDLQGHSYILYVCSAMGNDTPRNETITDAAGPAELPAGALFRVGDQQPVSLAHLDRVNPDLSPEDRAAIVALAVGESVMLAHEDSTVRVRRTR
jgi:hypothetical protein